VFRFPWGTAIQSENPNTGYGSGQDVDWHSSYAVRDIAEGEELFDDYGMYEYPEWFVQLAQEYGTPQDFIIKKDPMKPGFHIDYEVKPSSMGGVGLFAKSFVPKDALIWKYVKNCNIREFHTEAQVRTHLLSLSTYDAQRDWLSHVYAYGGTVKEILDDGRLWNHSEEPNTCSGVGGDWDSTFARRDIGEGEELVDDYGVYEYPDWLLKLYEEFNVPIEFVVIKQQSGGIAVAAADQAGEKNCDRVAYSNGLSS
jgi:hypothetical protein